MKRKDINLAISNIAKYGDTDIFPYPIEKLIFYDNPNEIGDLIEKIDNDFNHYLASNSPQNINTSVPLGYTGFRWATQIDPIWNAYYLSLVLGIAPEIEKSRIAIDENVVYSYRYVPNYDSYSLFHPDYNWLKFQSDSLKFLNENIDYKYVVICDIADFYNRIYHHPLENSLDRLSNVTSDNSKKIKKLIQRFSNTKSYGLPIGGEGSRILAELALNNTDRLMVGKGIKFKRFVDDIHIFCKSIEDAHSALNFLAMKLMRNEGLTLQKHKTQIQSRLEFEKLVASRINAESDNAREKERAKFMSLPINYDPYSDNAEEDYHKIKNQLDEFDVVGLLNDELKKVRIHQQFGKRLVKSLNLLAPEVISRAFESIINRFETLYPIFPVIMQSAYRNWERLEETTRVSLIDELRKLIHQDSYIIQSEINMCFLLRVLGLDDSIITEETILKSYNRFSDSILIKSVVLQIMTRWKAYHWLTDKKDAFSTMNKWERRIFIISANFLGDEGGHWLSHNKREFTDMEKIIMQWAKEKSTLSNWTMPL